MKRFRWASTALVVLLVASLGFGDAAEPGSGTVGPTSPVETWEGGPFRLGAVFSPEYCPPERDPLALCDHFSLTVDVDESYWTTHDGGVRLTIAWKDPADEFNLHVFRHGKLVGSSTITGAGTEQLVLRNASGPYEVRVTPVRASNARYEATAEFLSEDPAPPSTLHQAFNGVRIVGPNPEAEPQSVPTPYAGPPLVLQMVDVGRNAGEPTIGIDRSGVAFYIAGAWDCMIPQPGTPGPRFLTSCPRSRLLRSEDGGLTWEDVSPGLPAGFNDRHPVTYDPIVHVDDDSGRVFMLDLIQLPAGSELSFSDDRGESFTTTLAYAPVVNDRPSLTSGPVPDGVRLPTLDPNFDELVWYCAFQVTNEECMRSLDGGRTFTPTTPVFDPAWPDCLSNRGDVQTDRDGRVFIGHGHCAGGHGIANSFRDVPAMFLSEDAGLTWRLSIISKLVGITFPTLPQMAADADGNLYYVWLDDVHLLPYLATSTDHGRTWSDPLMIAPPGVHEVNFPTIVAGDAGKIAVTFIGTTVGDNDDHTRPWDSYVLVSTNALDPDPLFVSSTANPIGDPIHRGDCQALPCAAFRDFLDIQVSPFDGSIWATSVDTCTAVLECATQTVAGLNEVTGELGAAVDGRGLAIRQLSGPMISEGPG